METTRITIPKEISDEIDSIKFIYQQKNLTKQEWTILFLKEGLKKYKGKIEKLNKRRYN